MKPRIRIRLGLRLRFPFGMFPNAGVFVVHGDYAKIKEKVQDLQDVLYATSDSKATLFADMLFCELVQQG